MPGSTQMVEAGRADVGNMLLEASHNSVLAKPLAACTYLYSIVSELYDA